MKAWGEFFDAAGPSAADFETDGDVAAEDIIAGRVWELLVADSLLAEIFGYVSVTNTRIEILETRQPFDFRAFPRLQIYTSSTSETQSPTLIDVDRIRVYVAVRFDALNVAVVAPYSATLATLRKKIARVLKANKSLVVSIGGTFDVPLAMEMETGVTNWLWDQDPNSDRIAGTLEMEFLWRVNVDHESQRIDNLLKALP